MMNTLFYVICIFLLITPNLNNGSGPFKTKEPDIATSNNNEESDRLLQQSIDMLQKWLTFQTSKILGRIVQVDGSLNQKLFDSQQLNLYKFDVMTNSIAALQQHLTECKQTQQALHEQKEEVISYMQNIRTVLQNLDKLETQMEINNQTVNFHLGAIQDMFDNVHRVLREFHKSEEEFREYKVKTANELSKTNSKINQHEMVIGKLMDNAASSCQKANEIQQNTQHSVDVLVKQITSLKSQLEDHKAISKQLLFDQTEQFKREINNQRKKTAQQLSTMNLRFTTSIDNLNNTLSENHRMSQSRFEFLKKSIEAIVEELATVKNDDRQAHEYQDKILKELFIQKQEINKQAGVIKTVKNDIDVLVAFAGYKSPISSNRMDRSRRNFY